MALGDITDLGDGFFSVEGASGYFREDVATRVAAGVLAAEALNEAWLGIDDDEGGGGGPPTQLQFDGALLTLGPPPSGPNQVIVRSGSDLIGTNRDGDRCFPGVSELVSITSATPVTLTDLSDKNNIALALNIGGGGGNCAVLLPDGENSGQQLSLSVVSVSASNTCSIARESGDFGHFVESFDNATPALGHSLLLMWDGDTWVMRTCSGFTPVVP